MKQSKYWTPVVLGTCLLAAVSCGNDDDDNSSSVGTPPQEEQQQDQGRYAITFSPLNAGVGGNAAAGTGTIDVTDTSFKVTLNMTGVPARITHLQHIHAGTSCPAPSADVNADGFLDVLEGLPAYGAILVPLDGDLNSQMGGMTSSPRADSSGAYTYTETATLSRMLEDLTATDPNPNDPIVKLPAGENLNLEGRHVIIHGVPESANLPETVGTIEGAPREATLPIACGTITRIASEEDTGTTTGGTGTGTTTGETGTTTGETGTTGTTTGGTGTTGTTTGGTGTTTGTTGTSGL